MSKIFVHMDKGWPSACSTKRQANGKRIWHIRADHDPGNGAPWSLGMCGVEASLVAFEVRVCTRTIMYMFSRLRGVAGEGYDVECAPMCMWIAGGWYHIRIGNKKIPVPQFNLPIERQEFIERIEEELDKVFPSDLYSFPHNNWRDIL